MHMGMTIYDVVQVIGAGFSISNYAGEVATYVKLLRVSMLPVVIILLLLFFMSLGKNNQSLNNVLWQKYRSRGFVVILLVSSNGIIPATVQSVVTDGSKWVLVTITKNIKL